MQVWNVLHVVRCKYRTQKIVKNLPSGHHRRAISLQLRHVSTIGKKLVEQQYLLHMSPQYGELRPTSGWDRSCSLGTPANFNGFRVLAVLLHSSQVVGVRQTLRRWTEGATYIPQGDYHVGIGPHSSFFSNFPILVHRDTGSHYRSKNILLTIGFDVLQ